MQVYYGTYKILDWPYWFDVFIISFIVFVIIGITLYSLYRYQKDDNLDLELQLSCYITRLQTEQGISNSLEKENLKLRKEIQTLQQNQNKEKSKEISW